MGGETRKGREMKERGDAERCICWKDEKWGGRSVEGKKVGGSLWKRGGERDVGRMPHNDGSMCSCSLHRQYWLEEDSPDRAIETGLTSVFQCSTQLHGMRSFSIQLQQGMEGVDDS